MLDMTDETTERLQRASAKLERTGVRHVYFQFVSMSGRVLGKAVPVTHFERFATRGVRFHLSGTTDISVDLAGDLVGFDFAEHECLGIPDLETLAVLPWDPTVARVFCSLRYREDEDSERAGQPVAHDARGNLKRMVSEFDSDFGMRLRSGCEPEMMWFDSADAIQRRGHFPPHVNPAYHIGHLETLQPIVSKVSEYGQALGLDMTEGDYEDDRQLELTFNFDDCLQTADRLTTYRQICARVARELGVFCTFMPKPMAGVMGNGCHHNLSLWNTDRNLVCDADRADPHLTEIGQRVVAGILAHTAGMTAILAPTANSYARFWDEGLTAPVVTNWGFDNKTCTVRVAGGRLEFKTPDSAVNPYLSHAAILAAIGDGLSNQLDPGAAQEGDSTSADARAEARQLFAPQPKTLGEAVDALIADPVITAAFPRELLNAFVQGKRDEWARACGAVTDWHREMYLNILP